MRPDKLTVLLVLFLSTIFYVGCNSGGDDSGSNNNSEDGTFTINASGGHGGSDGGFGGVGGTVHFSMTGSAGDVAVRRSGTVDAGFTPTQEAADLGGNGLTIDADTTLAVADIEPALGTPYLLENDNNLYVSDGNGTTGDESPVTGLRVAAGVTVTLELNWSGGWAGGIVVSHDLVNDGTITPVDHVSSNRGALYLQCLNYHGGSGSALDTSGVLAGQDGGMINLTAYRGIFNAGRVSTTGAEGGSGGYIAFTSIAMLENTGAVTSAGASGGAGPGGDGDFVSFLCASGHVYNSGAIDTHGGDGTDFGGSGGSVEFQSGSNSGSGEVRNSGAISAHGGDGSGGRGGDGGPIISVTYGGDISNSGALDASGGDTSDPVSNGGQGSDVVFDLLHSRDGTLASGSLYLAGNIDISGGSALATGSGSGGFGGRIWCDLMGESASGGITLPPATPQEISLAGYTTILSNGGDGNTGGPGGAYELMNDGHRWDSGTSGYVDGPGGDVINEADVQLRGGSVVSSATMLPAGGGPGGYASFHGDFPDVEVNPTGENVVNSGDIDISGGDSLGLLSATRFNGGILEMVSANNVTNSGSVTAEGGSDAVDDGSPLTGFGHGGGAIFLMSFMGTTTNSGELSIDGGQGEALGGSARSVEIGGFQVVNSGVISARGGDADATLAGSQGGNGGDIYLVYGDGLDDSGHLDVSGGGGETAGADGDIFDNI